MDLDGRLASFRGVHRYPALQRAACGSTLELRWPSQELKLTEVREKISQKDANRCELCCRASKAGSAYVNMYGASDSHHAVILMR